MLQFTITGQFNEGDALEVALAWGYQEQVTVEELPDVWNNIPNPISAETFILDTMKTMCADRIAEVYKRKAYKYKEQLFLTEIEAQNAAITNNVISNITAEVTPIINPI